MSERVKKDSLINLCGKVVALVIFLIQIISLIYSTFHLDISWINPIIELIDGASVFLIFVCASFLVAVLSKKPRSYLLALFFGVDIILVSGLYRNSTWKTVCGAVYQWFYNVNKGLLIFLLVLAVIFGFAFWQGIKEIRRQKTAKDMLPFPVPETETVSEDAVDRKKEEIEDTGTKKEEKRDESDSKNNWKFLLDIGLSICAVVFILGVLDYIVFNVLPLNIQRPEMIADYQEILQYGAVICAAILIAQFFVPLCGKIKNRLKDEKNADNLFRISGIFAILLMLVFFLFWRKNGDQNNLGEITDKVLNALTDNWFTALFSLIIVYLLLQIMCLIVIHLFTGGKNDKMIRNLSSSLKDIEEKMVMLVCHVIEGCIGLFNFIPDFFSSIGIVLLGNEHVYKEDNPNDKPNENTGKKNNGKADTKAEK